MLGTLMKPFLIAAAALLGATAAQAADSAAAPYTGAPAPAYNWTGLYAGVNVGAGWQDTGVSYTQNDLLFVGLFGPGGPGRPLIPPTNLNRPGVVGGGQVGYNWQLNSQWLLGFEADFSVSGIRGSAAYATGGASPADIRIGQNVEWFGTVRGRLGWLPTDRLLVYGTGGFAYGRVKEDVAFYGPKFSLAYGGYAIACVVGQPCLTGSSSGTRTGWTAGGGLEYALGTNLTVKAEYLYVNLGSDSFRVSAVTHGSYVPMSFNARYSTGLHIARAGLNYRF